MRNTPPAPATRAGRQGGGVGRALIAFIRLGRPMFLVGGFLLYGLGAAIAAWHGHAIDATRYALGQATVTALQLMTHYANDYYDYECDRANPTPTRWSGGSRVLASGELPRHVALVAALVFGTLGAALGAVATALGGVWTAPTIVAMLALAWEYSAPPFRLCAIGAGELDTAVIVTGLVPWLGFYLQAPDLGGAGVLVAAIVPLALLQFAMLLAVEFSDAAGDAATGKRTLVVRLGARRAAALYAAATLAAYAWLPVALWFGLPRQVAFAAALPLPFAAWRVARIADHRDRAAFDRLASWAITLLVATSAAELIGFAT
jgi:1,4-dihydroxy-2-naphthoate octaprenyltransferase